MATPNSIDQLNDQRNDLVNLAVQRCEDILNIDPGFIERSNSVSTGIKVDPSKIIASHVETLKQEFYPEDFRTELIERGKYIYGLTAAQKMEERAKVLAMLDGDARVDTARVEATAAIRTGIRVEHRAAFDIYTGYEPSVAELERDLAQLSGEIERIPAAITSIEGAPAELSPRGLMISIGGLASRYLK